MDRIVRDLNVGPVPIELFERATAPSVVALAQQALDAVRLNVGSKSQRVASGEWLLESLDGALEAGLDKATHGEAPLTQEPRDLTETGVESMDRSTYAGPTRSGAVGQGTHLDSGNALVGPWTYDVWFGTNRTLKSEGPIPEFANMLDTTGPLRYGRCSVVVPKTHRFGSLGTAWWKRLLVCEPSDDHLKISSTELISEARDFVRRLGAALQPLKEHERQLLFYLHGYNTSFEAAALRAAQIGFDLKVQGATAFFSWPSQAKLLGYGADLAQVEASERQIAEFLTLMATETGATTVHIIAHSMGNRGLARAIQRITSAATQIQKIRFGQIILAAPDLDVNLFHDLAAVYPTISRRTTMYCCPKDLVLNFSSWIQSERAGFTPPITVVNGVDTVEVNHIDLTLLGHGYYAQSESIMRDMKELIDHDSPPLRRLRLRRSETPQGSTYWSMA